MFTTASYLSNYFFKFQERKTSRSNRVIQRSLVLIKPGAVKRNLIGDIIKRYQEKGLKIVGLKLLIPPKKVAEKHYGEHKGKKFYPPLIKYITSGPVVAMCWEGRKAVEVIRKMNGATNPDDALPGTIRGDFGLHIGRNVVHASDTPDNGDREVSIWFTDDELLDYKQYDFECLYNPGELEEEIKEAEEENLVKIK